METVEYFAMEGCPGEYFRCEKLSATLGTESCADMWRKAHSGENTAHRYEKCKGCCIGARHAGEGEASMSLLFGRRICARCHKLSRRFVYNDICVSCYNRQREWIKGRNARGTKPVKQPPLHPVSIAYIVGGEIQASKAVMSESTVEMVTRILRDSRKEVTFGFFRRALIKKDGFGEMVAD